MISDADHELIHRYLDQQMNEAEKQAFDNRLQAEPALRQELDIARSMLDFLDKKEDLDQMYRHIRNLKPGSQPRPRPFYKRPQGILAIAASVALLAVFAFLLADRLADPYGQFSGHRLLSGEQSREEAAVKQAIIDYNRGDYQAALPALEAMDTRDYPEFELAKGISYLELNRLETARDVFAGLASNQPIYRNDAYWYLALTSLRAKDYDAGINYLEQLEEDSSYGEQAGALRRLLERKR